MDWTQWPYAAALTGVFLANAALVARLAPREKPRLRMIGFFLLAYLLMAGGAWLAARTGWAGASRVGAYSALFFAWIVVIYLVALLLFKVILPRLGFGLPSIFGDLCIGAAMLVLLIAGLGQLGVDYTGLLTTSAVVTGILALSLQPTLGNIIGGVALQLDRSIREGDWIELQDGKQGRVLEIRWRHTVVETRDWDTVIVPNSTLLAANIVILGRRQDQPVQHRMWVYFNVDFRIRPTRVIRTAENALRSRPGIPAIAENPPPNCVCLDLASDTRESYVLYAVRYWLTDLATDDPISSLVRERLFAAFRRADIPFAIPAAQLFIDEDDEVKREEKYQRSIKQRLATLKEVEFLKVLRPEELLLVAGQLHADPFAADETIVTQGEPADSLYILVEGDADVWVERNNQREHVASLQAPTIFGEMGLMTGEPRSATIIARTPVLCYSIDRVRFRQVLADRPEIANRISEVLATRQSELDSVREHLRDARKPETGQERSSQLLARIQDFFGLG